MTSLETGKVPKTTLDYPPFPVNMLILSPPLPTGPCMLLTPDNPLLPCASWGFSCCLCVRFLTLFKESRFTVSIGSDISENRRP